MSLHSREKGYKDGVWMCTCHCGWESDPHDDALSIAAAKAESDYRQHIEEVLGAEAYYECEVACRNCGSYHRQAVLIGTHVTSQDCVHCGTTMLQPNNDVWQESNDRTRLRGF